MESSLSHVEYPVASLIWYLVITIQILVVNFYEAIVESLCKNPKCGTRCIAATTSVNDGISCDDSRNERGHRESKNEWCFLLTVHQTTHCPQCVQKSDKNTLVVLFFIAIRDKILNNLYKNIRWSKFNCTSKHLLPTHESKIKKWAHGRSLTLFWL